MEVLTLEKPDLESHLKTLGVDSIVGYKLWCYRHNLDTSTEKTPEQLQTEIDLLQSQVEQRDPDFSPRYNPNRAKFIARIFKGELQNETVSDVLFRIRAVYNNLDGNPDAQQALGRLVLHVDKYGDLLRPIRAIRFYGDVPVNTFISGLEQLARNHADWIRPVEDWRPEEKKPRQQFGSLLRHLLVKYEMPPFFQTAFFRGTTSEARLEQDWLKHIGMGQNIRTAGIPMRITKRMAHLVMQSRNHHETVVQALRRTQYQAFNENNGKSAWMSAWTLTRGPLGERFENEDFWETVVHFIANQTFLDRSYINPIIDYIRNQKYTPQRIPRPDGTEVDGPPPHPSFCMKGRSIKQTHPPGRRVAPGTDRYGRCRV